MSDDAPDVIPLADDFFLCAACGKSFRPLGGETVCRKCTHVAPKSAVKPVSSRPVSCAKCGYDLRGGGGRRCPECGTMNDGGARPEASPPHRAAHSRTERGAVAPALAEGSRTRILGVLLRALLILALVIGAVVIVARHWWMLWLDDWAIVCVWSLFTATALILMTSSAVPPDPDAWERRCGVIGFCAALTATGVFALYPLRAGAGGLLVGALLDLLVLVACVTFIIGSGRRLRLIGAWTGCDPHEQGYVTHVGPILLAIFIVSVCYLMTHFFRRGLDAADAYALGISAWLIWRSIELAWHANEALSSVSAEGARKER